MKTLLHILKPSRLKLIFLAQLPAFVLIELISSGSKSLDRLQVFLLPLVLYYLAGSTIVYLYEKRANLGDLRICLIVASLLLGLDQGVKITILHAFPVGHSVPLVSGYLYLAQAHNVYGSWLLKKLAWDFLVPGLVLAVILICIPVSIAAYRYYTRAVRRSLLADLAFVLFLAGFASAFADNGWRGFTVDFIQIPGYVVADFKDIYFWFGAACLLCEMFASPGGYWKMSLAEFLRAFGRMIHYQFHGSK